MDGPLLASCPQVSSPDVERLRQMLPIYCGTNLVWFATVQTYPMRLSELPPDMAPKARAIYWLCSAAACGQNAESYAASVEIAPNRFEVAPRSVDPPPKWSLSAYFRQASSDNRFEAAPGVVACGPTLPEVNQI